MVPPFPVNFRHLPRRICRAAVIVSLALAFAGAAGAAGAPTVAASLAEADRLMAKGDFSTALLWTAEAMKADPKDELLRWRAGNLLRHVPVLRLSLAHRAGVNSAAFSADGARIVTASQDNTARIWDAATGQPLGQGPLGFPARNSRVQKIPRPRENIFHECCLPRLAALITDSPRNLWNGLFRFLRPSSRSRGLAVSRSRGLAVSRSRGLAVSRSRGLAVSRSRRVSGAFRFAERQALFPVRGAALAAGRGGPRALARSAAQGEATRVPVAPCDDPASGRPT